MIYPAKIFLITQTCSNGAWKLSHKSVKEIMSIFCLEPCFQLNYNVLNFSNVVNERCEKAEEFFYISKKEKNSTNAIAS